MQIENGEGSNSALTAYHHHQQRKKKGKNGNNKITELLF